MKIMHEARNESSTEKIAAVCACSRVMRLPPSPAMRAPRSGANAATMTRSFILAFSSLERVQVFDVDGVQVAEQHHQDGEADGRFGGGDGQDEEDEHLPGDVAEEVREGDEVEIDCEQHQLD